MTKYITPERIANAILQDKSFVGTYILVEGNNDYTFYRKFVNSDLCEVQIAFGKENILNAIEILKERGYKNSIGILDADFRNLQDEPLSEEENIFFTDNHDLETMILESDAFNSLVDNYCENEKTQKFIDENGGQELKSILIQLLSPLGYLKWANSKEGWGLLFKSKSTEGPELKIEDFIPVTTLEFQDYEEMIKTVFNYSRGKVKINLKEDVTFEHVQKLSKKEVNHYQLCNGHDFAYLFSLALRRKIASNNAKAISAAQIEKDLIFSYDSRFFKETKLYNHLKIWEINEGRTILKF